MKFDEAIKYISENLTPVANKVATEMAKAKDPEIEKRIAAGMPYYKANAEVKALRAAGKLPPKGGAASPDVGSTDTGVPVAPVQTSRTAKMYKDLPDTVRTKEAVANYLQQVPSASMEEVQQALEKLNDEEAPLNLDPKVVQSAIDDVKSIATGGEEAGPDVGELKKSELSSKYDRMRQALYRARGFKTKSSADTLASTGSEEDDEEDEIIGGTGKGEVPSDEPIDPNTL